MKWIFVISLILNVYLGYSLYEERSKPPLERIVVEEKVRTLVKKVEVPTRIETQKVMTQKSSSAPTVKNDPIIEVEQRDYQDQAEVMENSKREFLQTQLGLSEEVLAKQDKLRQEFIRKTNEIYQRSPMGELSFEDRRNLIRMEEKFEADLQKTYGKKNWEKFQAYRRGFNAKAMERMQEGMGPGILMGN